MRNKNVLRHCEESAAGAMTKQSNKKFFYCIQVKGLDWIASSCRAALAVLAMTSFLTIATSPAFACPAWLATWRNHSGNLPGSSVSNTAGANATWTVTSNLDGIVRTIRGESRCVTIGALEHHCQCRRATMEAPASWSTSYSSAHGSGRNDCSGNLSEPCVGPWVFHVNYANFSNCISDWGCAFDCAQCVRTGSHHSCTRAAVLQ